MTNGLMISCKPSLKEDDSKLEQAILKRARQSFRFYYNNIFNISLEIVDGIFIPSAWHNEYCDRLQNYLKTCELAARKHGKTTVLSAFVTWLIFKCDAEKRLISEYLYIMFSDELAGEKLKRIKQYITVNPYLAHIRDLKPTAETILEYENTGHLISLKPSGIFSFKRGKHPDGTICDDILRDPQKKLDTDQIAKVTQVFEAEVTSLAKEGGFTHVAGTSQDETDIMFKLEKLPGWSWKKHPAILDRAKKEVLWPEQFPFKRLIDIELNETGKKNFQREYQLIPVRATEGFFKRGEIENIIDRQLENYNIYKKSANEIEFGETFGGLDIGKKRHPSHLAVFNAVEDNTGQEAITYLIQVASIWMDDMDYTEQLNIYRAAIARFRMQAMLWDNTRGEFEGFIERGELPEEMQPFIMTAGGQEKISADFDIQVSSQRIILLNDDRQTRSLLSVDGNLKAPQSADGHGDAFWSVAMAIQAYLNNSMKQFI